MAQEQIKIMKNMTNLMKLWFPCSNCPQKFESEEARNVHYRARHAEPSLSKTNSPSNPLHSKPKVIQLHRKGTESVKTTENTTDSTKLWFGCSYCLEKFDSEDARNHHQKNEHDGASLIDVISSSNSSDSKQTSNKRERKDVNGDIFRPTKHTQYGSSRNEQISNFLNHSSTNTKDGRIPMKYTLGGRQKIYCWQCSMEFSNVHGRIHHFIRCHCDSYLPGINVTSSAVSTHTRTFMEQMYHSQVAFDTWSTSICCWKCGWRYQSQISVMLHFITKHARPILYADTDPSSDLKNELLMAREWGKTKKTTATDIRTLSSDVPSLEKLKSPTDDTNHANNKHTESPQPTISKVFNDATIALQKQIKIAQHMSHAEKKPSDGSKHSQGFTFNADHTKINKCPLLELIMSSAGLKNRTEIPQEYTKITVPKTNALHISYYCQQCHKQFTCATDHIEHFKTAHDEVTSSAITTKEDSIDDDIMKCPKAAFLPLVYILSGTIRKQICITPGKTNRCPHEVCKSNTTNYSFGELSLHIKTDHQDAQLKLECCNPMITYTTEEYKEHLLHAN